MKHSDGTPCRMAPPFDIVHVRSASRIQEEESEPHKALTDECHDEPANDQPSPEPARTTLKCGEGGAPQTRNCQCERKKPRRDALDWLTFAVLCATFFALVIYACYARRQAIANKDAADATAHAAKANAEQVRAFKAVEAAYLHIHDNLIAWNMEKQTVTIPVTNDGQVTSRQTKVAARMVTWMGDAMEEAVETMPESPTPIAVEIAPRDSFPVRLPTMAANCIHVELVVKYDAGFGRVVTPQPRFCVVCGCADVLGEEPPPDCFATLGTNACSFPPTHKILSDIP